MGPGGKSREIRQALRGGWLLVVADMEPLPISGTGSWLPVLYRFSLKSMDDRNDIFYTCWDEDLMFTAVNFEVEPPE